MIYDFFAEKYGQFLKRNWRPYTKLKLIEIGNTEEYSKQIIGFYEKYEIDKNLNLMEKIKLIEFKNYIPDYSAFIKINFKLKKPYISADDETLYPKDNPICKDKIFKIPMIRPSSWKGNLRWVARNILGVDEEKVERLFGNEKSNETARRGRINIYPTFFNKIALDIINPHDRKTRTGKGPIQIEIVPEGTEGKLQIFYCPFDSLDKLYSNQKEQKEKTLGEIKEDLQLLSKIVKETLLTYGFSAKRTSGYGVVEESSINGNIKFGEIDVEKNNFSNFGELNLIIEEGIQKLKGLNR